ncbi:MAG: YncE family protein [Acidobacteriota bacterium]
MTNRWAYCCWGLVVCAGVALGARTISAQIAVSANDNKTVLVDGVQTVVKNPQPDTVTLVDLSVSPPRLLGSVQAPNSVIGPPQNVAIAPGGAIALVASSTKIDPADATKTVPDDVVSVIDLKGTPPRVITTLHAGRGASGISFSPDGKLALVANRMAGTISVFAVEGAVVTPAGTVDLGAPDSGPSHVVFTRDGRRALVTRNNDSLISLLSVDGRTVTYTKRDIAAGLKPYGIEVTPAGDAAVVAHIGAGALGGVDTLAVIDLTTDPLRVVDQIAAGPTVEGLAVSADGQYVAATVMDGSNLSKSSPFFHEAGRLRVFQLRNRRLTAVADAPTGHWCQGAAWSRDHGKLVVQCMADRNMRVFAFDGKTLTPAGLLPIDGGPAGIRVAP